MKSRCQKMLVIVLAQKFRKEGQADIGGKTVSWSSGETLTFIVAGDEKGQPQKKVISPEIEEDVLNMLETVSWGAAAYITIEANQITSLELVKDGYADLFDEA